jgi:hypothetical protein
MRIDTKTRAKLKITTGFTVGIKGNLSAAMKRRKKAEQILLRVVNYQLT